MFGSSTLTLGKNANLLKALITYIVTTERFSGSVLYISHALFLIILLHCLKCRFIDIASVHKIDLS